MAQGTGGTKRIRIAKGIHIYWRPDAATWFADLVHRGRRARPSLGTVDEEEARTRAIQEAGKLRSEVGPVGSYSFYRALIDWSDYSPRSKKEESMVGRLKELYSNRPANEVTGGSIAAALAGLTPGYANRIASIARAALNLAVEHEHIPAAPKIARRKTGPGRDRFLTPQEWISLQKTLPDYLLPVVQFSIETGLRRANALQLRWAQVDMNRATAWVEAMRAKARVAIPVPLSPAALTILRRQKGRHPEFVFTRRPAPKARPDEYVPIGDPKNAWKTALEDAEIADFRWHDQRHTWASWHTMNGTPAAVLTQLGGWASADMVERYTHLEPGHLRQFAGAGGTGLGEAVKRAKRQAKSAAKKRQARPVAKAA